MEPIEEFEKDGKNYGLFKCELCEDAYEYLIERERDRFDYRKTHNKQHICKKCIQKICNKKLVEAGKRALKAIPQEERLKICSEAGKKAAKKTNSGRFTSERWQALSKEEQKRRVTRANKALHEKLKDPKEKEKHFQKIFKQKKIGYQSVGHKDLHRHIEDWGFKTHINIGGMEVDECNEELKIVIEYNGDFWHCNPQKWKKDDYNSAIKMTAGEKWQKDIARKKVLIKMGYDVIVIWESDWEVNKEKYLNRIENAISKKGENQ